MLKSIIMILKYVFKLKYEMMYAHRINIKLKQIII